MTDQLALPNTVPVLDPLEAHRPPSPAVWIKREMKVRRWKLWDLVYAMTGEYEGLDYLAIEMYFAAEGDTNCILGEEMIAQLAKAFSVEPQFIRDMEDAYRKGGFPV